MAVTVSPLTSAFNDTLVNEGSTPGPGPVEVPDPAPSFGVVGGTVVVVALGALLAGTVVVAAPDGGREPVAGDDGADPAASGTDPAVPGPAVDAGAPEDDIDGSGPEDDKGELVGPTVLETGADTDGPGTAVVIESADGAAHAESNTSRAAATAPPAYLRVLRMPVLRKMLLSGGRNRPLSGGSLETLKHHESTAT